MLLAWTTLGEFDDMCAGDDTAIAASMHNEAGAAGLICRIQNADNTSSQVSVHVPTDPLPYRFQVNLTR